MKSLLNYAAFNVAWALAVGGAAQGRMWDGPLAALALVGLHLVLLPARERLPQLGLVLVAGLLGSLADSGLRAAGLLTYPTSPPSVLVPAWITALWVAFGTLPRLSLAWLAPRPRLAAALGAVAGPLCFVLGRRMGAIDAGENLAITCGALAVEYAVATPALLLVSTRLHREV